LIEVEDAQPLKRRRTEEERLRRHLHGDKGATFSKGKESYIGNDGIMNTVTTVFSKDNIIAEIMESNKRYRIRKLTPRKCFRLMDLNENDIDKIQAAGISESQQYKLAGNSIVVACMEGIFRNLFSNEEQETLTL
jgi:site-specific DNA-cytosine methylase